MTIDDLKLERQGILHQIEMLQHKDLLDREDKKTLSRWQTRIEEIDAILYPAPTRAEGKLAEIALEDRDGIPHIRAHLSIHKGGTCTYCGRIRR